MEENKHWKILFGAGIFILIAVGVVWWAKEEDKSSYIPDIKLGLEDSVVLYSPKENEEITATEIEVRGEAPGMWFFEANIPISIFDGRGNILGQVGAMAVGDWMTVGPVQFSGLLSFDPPHTATGTIVVSNDNPSGIKELSKSVSMPVRFSPSLVSPVSTTTVEVYFGKYSQDSSIDGCAYTEPVSRSIQKIEAVGKAAIEELLKGPTEEEKNLGLFTSIPDGVSIRSLVIENGIAEVDFNSNMNYASGSCRTAAVRAQIENTLKQFSSVSDVIISVDGEVGEALQP